MKKTSLKESPVSEDLAFYGRHPKYYGQGPLLRGTYRLCQLYKAKDRMYVSLQECYDHISCCEKCKKTMTLKIEMIKHPE